LHDFYFFGDKLETTDHRFWIAFVQLENVQQLTAESSVDDIWAAQMLSFSHNARTTLKFAKKIPG